MEHLWEKMDHDWGHPHFGKAPLLWVNMFSRRLSERILLGHAKLHWASQLRLQWLHVEFATDHSILTPTAGLNVIKKAVSLKKIIKMHLSIISPS